MTFASTVKFYVTTGLIFSIVGAFSYAHAQTVDPALQLRLVKEKADRADCKIDICKAFAAPTQGAPISCDVTKTWLKDELLERVVGGSYVWSYGHMQCNVKLNLDRTAMGKALSAASDNMELTEHKLICHVEDRDAAKGEAFKIEARITPKISFESGKVKSVKFDPVKTEGSSVASAAVSSLLAVDKVSGMVSRAAAKEFNTFLFDHCKADGVEIAERK